MAQYAGRWQTTPAALQINQVLSVEDSLNDSSEGTSGAWNLIDPRGQRVLGLSDEKPGFIQLKMPGHYEVRSNKRTDWVAVNTPPEESDLSAVALEEFQAVFVPREARVETEVSLEASVQEKDRQQSLWWLFLLVGVAVFMAEWLVANRIRPASGVQQES